MAPASSSSDRSAPADEYRGRLTARRAAQAALDRTDARIARGRLLTFTIASIVALLAWFEAATFWLLLLPVVAFVVLMRRHDRVLRARDAAARAAALYERGLARLADEWAGTGDAGERFLDERHLYARDLDLFGRGSLFQLLSLARTRKGEETLARWLTHPGGVDAAEIGARQAAVAELTAALDLREAMSLAGGDVRAAVDSDRLLSWAEARRPSIAGLETFTRVLTAAAAVAVVHWLLTGGLYVLLPVILLEGLCTHVFRRQIEMVLHGDDEAPPDFVADVLGHRARDLDVIAGLLTRLEQETFVSPRLRSLQDALRGRTADQPAVRPAMADQTPVRSTKASQAIRRLHRLAELHDWERSVHLMPLALLLMQQVGPAFAIAAGLLLWKPYVVVALERWRARHGGSIRTWLDAIGESEALMSLAGYRCEHPDDPFPEIVAASAPQPHLHCAAIFDAEGLGHPLLPSTAMVRNDVRLTGATSLLVVSGSNMSGKSTLLRTAGINAVLALAGAPVRARSLRLSPLVIGATLRIQDSLQEGRSRFYAEVTRIRALVDAARGPVPVLFLLDELLHGTNSHDRLAGATGILRSLIDLGAIGLVTTHDLALATIADDLAPRAVNVHFEEWFDGGEMRFDYRLKPGPVQRSNALELMRAVGLDAPSGQRPRARGQRATAEGEK
jgi:hypothetical protein